MSTERHWESPARFVRPLASALTALSVGFAIAACDDNKSGSNYAPPSQNQAQNTPPSPPATPPTVPDRAQPPTTAPGAGPSAARLVGTWAVSESKGGPADSTKSDRTEATTYRFEEGGRVTVAGSKQCAYTMQEMELKVDCNGQITAGKVEFPDNQTMVWTVAGDHVITLKKR